MADINQIIFIASIAIITILLTVLGIQFALILREVHRSIEKINKVIDDVGGTAGNVSKYVREFAGFSAGMKTAMQVFQTMRGDKKEKNNGQ